MKTAHIGRCPEKLEVGSGGEPEQGMIFPCVESHVEVGRGVCLLEFLSSVCLSPLPEDPRGSAITALTLIGADWCQGGLGRAVTCISSSCRWSMRSSFLDFIGLPRPHFQVKSWSWAIKAPVGFGLARRALSSTGIKTSYRLHDSMNTPFVFINNALIAQRQL